jgi:sugar lactone lactonase YvrE
MSPDGHLYVSAPTLASYDAVRRISPNGAVETLAIPFGRPQGLAFDAAGTLYVVEALAGASGVYAVRPGSAPELMVAGAGLVGLAFGPGGQLAVASGESLFTFAPDGASGFGRTATA